MGVADEGANLAKELALPQTPAFVTTLKPPATQTGRPRTVPVFQIRTLRLSESSTYQLADPGNRTHIHLAPKPAPSTAGFHLSHLPRAPSCLSAEGLPVQVPVAEGLLVVHVPARV